MPFTEPKKKSRRRFLLRGIGIAGALIVGWGVMPQRQRMHTANPIPVKEGEVQLNGWIRMATDGSVTVAIPQCEMGQGVYTALPMLVAEEMDVPLSAVKIERAPIDKIFGNVAVLRDGLPFHPDDDSISKDAAVWLTGKVARELGLMITGGSSSVKDTWGPLREAGAAARAMLVAVAAGEWNVAPADCRTEDGAVVHASGKRAGYGDLASKAATASAPAEIRLKEPKDFKLIGTPQPRRDSRDKVDGSAVFGLDPRPQGLIHAAVRMCPTIGGSVQKIDAGAIKSMPGVIRTVDFSDAAPGMAGVAVLAASYWQAKQAVDALPVTWNEGPNARLSTAGVFRELAAKLGSEPGFTYHSAGIADSVRAVKSVQAEYSAPFLAHATMEPVNCTAQVKDGKVTLWASTQVPSIAVNTAARVAGVKAEDVTLHVTYIGGGFGRRLEVDMIAQGVAIAKQAGGAPVQVIWSREEDIAHDFYRPAALSRFIAWLDSAGNVVAYDNKLASDAILHQVMERTFGLMGAGPDKSTAEGAYDMPYEFPQQSITHVTVPTPVPVGYWRSVGNSHNAFFKESFIDELAHAANKDPVEFRRSLLTRHPRHLAVLDAAVAKAGKPATGRAHGVALHQCFGSIVAEVAEVSVDNNEIRVHKVVCAIDCGIAVNPNIIAQQMESGVIFGLSAALFGEVTIKDGQVEQRNFHDYPVLRINQAPVVETVIISSAEPPEGVGEPGTPPVAPAVANAVFLLTGKRLRSLPLRLS